MRRAILLLLLFLPVSVPSMADDVCCSSPIPGGWVIVNDTWIPTACGNPTAIVYNVCTIDRFDNRPVGARMTVCASAPTPAGWVEENNRWDPTRCGRPATITNNVKVIRRVS